MLTIEVPTNAGKYRECPAKMALRSADLQSVCMRVGGLQWFCTPAANVKDRDAAPNMASSTRREASEKKRLQPPPPEVCRPKRVADLTLVQALDFFVLNYDSIRYPKKNRRFVKVHHFDLSPCPSEQCTITADCASSGHSMRVSGPPSMN